MGEIRSYLVQRGKFYSNADIISKMKSGKVEGRFGFLVDLDYMGSSEFEWGALPKSLKEFRENTVASFDMAVNGKSFTCFYVENKDKEQVEQIKAEIERLGKNQYPSTKEVPYFFNHINKARLDAEELQRFKPRRGETPRGAYGTDFNFWWDIDNQFVWFPSFYRRDMEALMPYIKKGSNLK